MTVHEIDIVIGGVVNKARRIFHPRNVVGVSLISPVKFGEFKYFINRK